MADAQEIAQALQLQEHREGGSFREVFRSIVKTQATKQRRAATSIFYMLRGKQVSRWHLVKSDEIWMYHAGSSAIQLLLLPDGTFEERVVGPDVLCGEFPQSIIPAWTWQAAVLSDQSENSWGLFGAVVCPGFEFEDYMEGDAEALIRKYPEAAERIRELGL